MVTKKDRECLVLCSTAFKASLIYLTGLPQVERLRQHGSIHLTYISQ
jgi:hypothetical protein